MTRAATLGFILLLALARPAAAEWHFTPMIGLTAFGDTSLVDLENATGKRHRQFGGSVSWLGGGLLGLEGLVSWTPGLFEGDDVSFTVNQDFPVNQEFVKSSRSIVGMGNIVLTLPRRWTEYGLRPFFSGGFGVMHVAKEDIGIFPVELNLPAFNVGGGAVGFFSQRTGVRFDVRYHSTLRRTDQGPVAIGPVHVRYMTASIGLVFRR
jgi:hypothetical protein